MCPFSLFIFEFAQLSHQFVIFQLILILSFDLFMSEG